MPQQPSTETFPPLTDAELAAAEQRAHLLPKDWPREELLRLIAEVRRIRRVLRTPLGQGSATPAPEILDPDYTPPGGRVTMAEWHALADRLEAQRGPLPRPRPPAPEEREARQRRWEKLRAELGWDAQPPLTAEQETELTSLVRDEIEAHRLAKQRKRKRGAGGG